jgi:hypothetical protein
VPDNARRPYKAGLEDEDPAVRRAALLAAAWARESWVLEHCRVITRHPAPDDWDAVLLLAILGRPEHVKDILAVGEVAELGPRRFQALGAFGHPKVVPVLLGVLGAEDPAAAAAAGAAFMKITGVDINTDKRVQVPTPGLDENDEFEREFLDEVVLPDAQRAQAHWSEAQARYSAGTRWCRGFDLSRGVTDDLLDRLDMESRWEACLRGRYEGTWKGSLVDRERFPMVRDRQTV